MTRLVDRWKQASVYFIDEYVYGYVQILKGVTALVTGGPQKTRRKICGASYRLETMDGDDTNVYDGMSKQNPIIRYDVVC